MSLTEAIAACALLISTAVPILTYTRIRNRHAQHEHDCKLDTVLSALTDFVNNPER
jgi:hypothetical protein